MTPETIFQIANLTALAGWIALLASPLIPTLADRIAGLAVPLLLAVAYVGLVLAFFGQADGGFDTLANVMRLFTTPEAVLAGWLHYLAFDLFIGAWEVRKARAESIAFLLVVPCLALTFMFGPAGLLAFMVIRAARAMSGRANSV
ncbi:MAG: DUF4281 domain-containing protein [Rhodomicrobium sp.]|nr:DUF4281 domain-containing protein [Rhodomicrobium sp.]